MSQVKKGALGIAAEDPKDPAYKAYLKQPFLDVYFKTETIYEAADKVGVDRKTVTRWRESDPVFAEKFDEVRERWLERLKKKTRVRAESTSDTLAMFHIKQADPSYRDRVQLDLVIGTVNGVVAEISEALRRIIPAEHWPTVEEEFSRILNQTSQGGPLT